MKIFGHGTVIALSGQSGNISQVMLAGHCVLPCGRVLRKFEKVGIDVKHMFRIPPHTSLYEVFFRVSAAVMTPPILASSNSHFSLSLSNILVFRLSGHPIQTIPEHRVSPGSPQSLPSDFPSFSSAPLCRSEAGAPSLIDAAWSKSGHSPSTSRAVQPWSSACLADLG